MKKPYHWILFDADDTLFHFDAYSGLKKMLADFGAEFTPDDFIAYQAVNQPLWRAYQNNQITADELNTRRFQAWAEQFETTPKNVHQAFMAAMSETSKPLPGAQKLLEALKDRVKMGIITNGFSNLLHARLQNTGFDAYFDVLVSSDTVGVAKPHQGIFQHTLSLMSQPRADKVLMVGDTLDTDIRGGKQAGMHTCWLNPHALPLPEGPERHEHEPHYEVDSLHMLHDLLL